MPRNVQTKNHIEAHIHAYPDTDTDGVAHVNVCVIVAESVSMPHRIEIHLYIRIRLTELLASSATDRIRNVRCYLIASRQINRTAKEEASMYVCVIPAHRSSTLGTLRTRGMAATCRMAKLCVAF